MNPAAALVRFLEVLRANGCADLADRVEGYDVAAEAMSSGWLERGLAERSREAREVRAADRARRLGRAIEASWRVGFALLSEMAGDANSAARWAQAAARELEGA